VILVIADIPEIRGYLKLLISPAIWFTLIGLKSSGTPTHIPLSILPIVRDVPELQQHYTSSVSRIFLASLILRL
jgi:hypothetical protein